MIIREFYSAVILYPFFPFYFIPRFFVIVVFSREGFNLIRCYCSFFIFFSVFMWYVSGVICFHGDNSWCFMDCEKDFYGVEVVSKIEKICRQSEHFLIMVWEQCIFTFAKFYGRIYCFEALLFLQSYTRKLNVLFFFTFIVYA